MSTFVGWLNLDGAPAPGAALAPMMQRMERFGPDGSGVWSEGSLAIGHRLLSITPESRGESSPHRSRDGRLVIAYDGRLDHREDLLAALGLPSSEARLPDPELILTAYEKWGQDCVLHLDGEFAFALWNRETRTLFCAQDPFGRRGFHYFTDSRRFLFSTEITALLAAPGVPCTLEERVLAKALGARTIQVEGDATFYEGIRRLLGGRTLTVTPGVQHRPQVYWQLSMEPEIRLGRSEDYVAALREMLERSTRSALRTHHPVAAMLSGGLDSTGIACLAARELATRGQSLVTVSNILPKEYQGEEWGREESHFIQDALKQYPNMEPHWALGLKYPVVSFEDEYFNHHGGPDRDTKSFRTRELFELAAARGARVTLGGSGGDMAPSFRGTGYLLQLARSGHWINLATQIQLQTRQRGMTASGIFRREVVRPLMPAWIRSWNDRIRHGDRSRDHFPLLNPSFATRLGLKPDSTTRRPETRHEDFRKNQVTLFNSTGGPGGSSWSRGHCPNMESPQPLLDPRIWSWCHRVPVGEFIRDGMPRSLYRRALHDVLPASILKRTSKGWFAPDYQHRMASCRPAIEAFLEHHPRDNRVWEYVNRALVEDTLARLDQPASGDWWDNRFQLVLCNGLRIAHFISWVHRHAGRPA
jgi:asparagine synthase (glutamine-hydrolysing)